jgi:hypothetical protein
MGPSEIRAFSGPRQSGPRNNPRLRLKGKAPITGYVDGAWWPHDDDLQMELPELLPVLAARLGAITRVTYHIAEWAKAPLRIVIDGRSVRLDGYNAQPANTLGFLDAYGNTIVLLIVPARTKPDRAHSIVMAASTTDDASTVQALLSG